MIKARRSVIDFDRKFDRHKSEIKKNIRLEYKLSYINDAQEIIFENRVDLAETNSAVRNDLRVFEEKKVELSLLRNDGECSVYKFPDKFFRMLRHSALIEKEGCGTKIVPIIMFQMDDLDMARNSVFWRSSFEWEHLLGDEGKEGLYLWHEGDFTVKKVFIDYYRRPQEIHAPSMHSEKQYEDWNGIIRTKDQDCEFVGTFLYRKIIDMAKLLALSDLGDVPDYNIKYNSIIQTEKLNY